MAHVLYVCMHSEDGSMASNDSESNLQSDTSLSSYAWQSVE